MRFGGNTFSFMWTSPAEQAIDALVGLGLNNFDVIMSPGHLWPVELDGPQRSALRRRLEAAGIRLASLNPPALDFNLGSSVANIRSMSIELYEDSMRLASDIGAEGVVVVPGRVSALFPPPPYDTRRWLGESVLQLSQTAESLGLRLHLETHPLTSMPKADMVKAFIESIGSPVLGVAYDLSNAEFIGEDQAEAIRTLGPHLSQLHVSDGTRQSWRHDAVGEGTVNFRAAFDAAKSIGFAGDAIIELISSDPMQAYQRTIKALASLDAVPLLTPAKVTADETRT